MKSSKGRLVVEGICQVETKTIKCHYGQDCRLERETGYFEQENGMVSLSLITTALAHSKGKRVRVILEDLDMLEEN